MGLYTAVTLSDKHNRKVSPSGLKGPQGQDQPQGETSEGIDLCLYNRFILQVLYPVQKFKGG